MANRDMTHQLFSFEKARKFVNLRAVVGAAGAVTLDAPNSKGVASVTRNAPGNWTVQFGYLANGNLVVDQYNRLVGFMPSFDTTAVGANKATACAYGADIVGNTVNSTGQIVIQMSGPASGTSTLPAGTDPAPNEVVYLQFEFADSSAP